MLNCVFKVKETFSRNKSEWMDILDGGKYMLKVRELWNSLEISGNKK